MYEFVIGGKHSPDPGQKGCLRGLHVWSSGRGDPLFAVFQCPNPLSIGTWATARFMTPKVSSNILPCEVCGPNSLPNMAVKSPGLNYEDPYPVSFPLEPLFKFHSLFWLLEDSSVLALRDFLSLHLSPVIAFEWFCDFFSPYISVHEMGRSSCFHCESNHMRSKMELFMPSPWQQTKTWLSSMLGSARKSKPRSSNQHLSAQHKLPDPPPWLPFSPFTESNPALIR